MDRGTQLKIACPSCGQKLDVTANAPFEEVQCPTCGCTIVVPKLFGAFLLEEEIGHGGMATVYRALDLTLHRDVAIKVLNPDMADHPETAELFLREGRAAAAINHIHVLPIYSSGEQDEQPYLVMQYMEGLSLDRQLDRVSGRLGLSVCLRLGIETARGLEAALGQGIVHHDVKPANILLDTDGVVKVGDFGLAQVLTEGVGTEAESTAQWATPHYVSPEKVLQGGEDYRGDIYSLGATLYHMFAGAPPFDGDSADAIMKARLTHEPMDLTEVRDDMPPAVNDLVQRMLHNDRERRPQDYQQIIEVLETTKHALDAGHPTGKMARLPKKAAPSPHQFPRLILRDSVSSRAARLRNISRRKASKTNGLTDWILIACLLALLAFLLLSNSGRLFGDANQQSKSTNTSGEKPETAAASKPDEQAPTNAYKSARPRPRDLNFRAVRSQVDDYLAGLPDGIRQVEFARMKRLVGLRSKLAAGLLRHSYTTPREGILLRSGERLEGTLLSANRNGIELRGRTGEGIQHVRWNNLAQAQILDCFLFIVERNAATGESDARRKAAETALDAAVFCEWFRVDERLPGFLDKALELSSTIRNEARKLFPTLVD